MSWLLDTNIISFAMRNLHGVAERIHRHPPSTLTTSIIVLAEGLTGAQKSARSDNWINAWRTATREWRLLDFDATCADHYARIRAHLEKNGCMIGLHDCQIAATALAHNLIVVTDNLDEFRRVPGLRVENWVK
jgi:tRNA(fMet)-specific endonuclease VapC